MSVEQLKLVTEITPEQTTLLEQVEPLKQEQQARRQQMKADRLTWEQGILAMAQTDKDMPKNTSGNMMALAQEGMTTLEGLLIRQPPEGVTAAEVADFFRRRRSSRLNALAAILGTR